MKQIIECVPNFSEGQNKETIEAIAEAIRKVEGVTLLDVDPGFSTNRTVYTFVGDKNAVIEGALASARVAAELIDMRHHKGEHPRMGAMDVCPFIPVANSTMDDCVECANEFGRRAAEELGIQIFLYEEAAEKEYRKKLPQIRKGEYEGMAKKVILPEWKPDFGGEKFNEKLGVTATGARFFLIAYNVNIIGTHNQAHRIALDLREAGRGEGQPGKLKEVKGMGWMVDEYNLAQITMNLTNYKVTPMHIAFEEAKKGAVELNVAVAGSELVGLIPLEAMLMAADYYIEKENLFIIDEDQKIKLVIDRLGLNSISQFDPEKRIIDYLISEKPNAPLASSTVRSFIEQIAARTSAPGGGSAAAAIAGIGSALGMMVAQLTYGVRKFEKLETQLRKIIPQLNDSVAKLIPSIDADTNAFNDYMEAIRLPKSTDEEKKIRENAMQEGLKKAITVPLATMKYGDLAWDAMVEVAKIGNYNSRSDIEVGARALEVGIWGAYKNVMINLPGITDDDYVEKITDEAVKIKDRANEKCIQVLEILAARKD